MNVSLSKMISCEYHNIVEINQPGTIYFIGEKENDIRTSFVKVGYVRSHRNIKDRILELNTGNPRKLILLDYIDDVPRVSEIETICHKMLYSKRVHGEWFILTVDDISDIKIRILNMIDRFPKETHIILLPSIEDNVRDATENEMILKQEYYKCEQSILNYQKMKNEHYYKLCLFSMEKIDKGIVFEYENIIQMEWKIEEKLIEEQYLFPLELNENNQNTYIEEYYETIIETVPQEFNQEKYIPQLYYVLSDDNIVENNKHICNSLKLEYEGKISYFKRLILLNGVKLEINDSPQNDILLEYNEYKRIDLKLNQEILHKNAIENRIKLCFHNSNIRKIRNVATFKSSYTKHKKVLNVELVKKNYPELYNKSLELCVNVQCIIK